MSGRKADQLNIKKDEGTIIILDSSDEEEPEPPVAETSKKTRDTADVIILDSDDEESPEKHSQDDVVEVISDTEEQSPAKDLPIIISDDEDSDSDDFLIIEENPPPEGQSFSTEETLEYYDVLRYNSSDDTGENLYHPEAKLGISYGKKLTKKVVEASRKRKCKTKNIQPRKKDSKTKNMCVVPAVGRRTRACISQKKRRAARSGQHETRRAGCNIPGCFLHGIETVKEYSGRKLKKNRDELVQRLYILLNKTVFYNKLPKKLEVKWNTKMLRTAGLCRSCHLFSSKKRYTKIEISVKVCDSADRIRDTLIHELCHVASWMFNGIRDSHGYVWQYYARRCNMVHPELPLVTRFHNFRINYKIFYQCSDCKIKIGRYTRSLNTKLYVCGRCNGNLVLLPLLRKDGTPIKPHVRPFALYVKNNYRIVKEAATDKSHGVVMRKLKKDYFICKEKKML